LYCIKLFSGNFFHWANENVTKKTMSLEFLNKNAKLSFLCVFRF
jgi:hypothetical protein